MAKRTSVQSKSGEHGSVLLDIPSDLLNIPEWLVAESRALGYKAKGEYHVTVIGIDLAQAISNSGNSAMVQSLIDAYTWTIHITDLYVELAKDDEDGIHRQSIIGIVIISELQSFYFALQKILGQDIAVPPAHVTLFTKNYDRGIGVYSDDDLHRFRVRVLTIDSDRNN